MPRKKTRYFLLSVEDDIGSCPISWSLLPDELIEKCPATMIQDTICYSIKEGKFEKDSVLYFSEIDKKEAESISTSDNWIEMENKKSKIIFIL